MIITVRGVIFATLVFMCSYMTNEYAPPRIVVPENSLGTDPYNHDMLYDYEENTRIELIPDDVSKAQYGNGFPHSAAIDKLDSGGYDIRVYDSDSHVIKIIRVKSTVFFGIEVVDINVDGYLDLLVCTGGYVSTGHDVYLWNNELKEYIPVTFVGFSFLSYFQIYDGYLLQWVKQSYRVRYLQKLVWEGYSLRLEAEELLLVVDNK